MVGLLDSIETRNLDAKIVYHRLGSITTLPF